MKQLITLLLITLISINSKAQESVKYQEIKKGTGVDETTWRVYTNLFGLVFTEKCVSGPLKGYVIDYYPITGYKKCEGMMDEKKYIGLWKFYSEASKEQIRKTINYNNNGEKHGENASYDSLTQILIAKGEYKNDKRVGEWMFFDGNTGTITSIEKMMDGGGGYDYEQIAFDNVGNVVSKGKYVNKERSGEWTHYYSTGALKSKIPYKMGKRNGIAIFYDSISHLIETEEEYKDGVLNGVMKNYFTGTNKLDFSIEYKDGKKEGKEIWYDSLTGYIVREAINKDGKGTGLTKRYYPGSKKIKMTIEYQNDQPNGVYSNYDSATGILLRQGLCEDGELVGEWINYYPGTEKIRSKNNYTKHSEKYKTTYYDFETGKKVSYGLFNNDKRQGKWVYYYKDGSSVRQEIMFVNDLADGTAKIYDSSTTELKAKGEFVKGKREGKWKFYNPTTKTITTEENYLGGKLEGVQKRYDDNEDIVLICNYHNGKQEGEHKVYYKGTKSVWYTCNYKNDLLEGEVHTYFPSGKLRRFEVREKGKMISGDCYGESGSKVPFYNFYGQEQCSRPFDYYVKVSMAYPAEAIEQKIQGIVRVSFDIDTSGNVDNIQLVEGIGAGCDEEAIRLITYMPQWLPRTIDGVEVPCTHIQDIEFRL